MANENTKELPMWKRIKQGDRLPCQSFLRKYDGEILRLTTTGGVTVGQDCFYLPVENVIEEIRKYPIEEPEDERIINNIRKVIGWYRGMFTEKSLMPEQYQEIDAWLDKKGERKHQYKSRPRYVGEENLLGKKISNQKTADKVEPKFKVGDWVVVNDGRIGRIIECTKHFADIDLDFSRLSTRINNIRYWNVQDAKHGDVLVFSDHGKLVVGIVSYINKNTGKVDVYCLLEDNNFKVGNFYALDTINPHPATKEQRALLFQKMKEAGYEWDVEKKELKKVEQKPILDVEIPFGAKDSELEEVTYVIPKGYHAEIEDNKVVIKKGNKKSSWSEEDEMQLDAAIHLVSSTGHVGTTNWLKSLKDRMHPKQEWSEEDKNALKVVTDAFEQYGVHLSNYPAFVHWLKTLPERISFNPHWRPSEEHLDALNNMRFAVQHFGPSASLAALDDLYNQLENLTE